MTLKTILLKHIQLFTTDLNESNRRQSSRPEVKIKTRYSLVTLSRYASDYWEDFETNKIIYPDIVRVPQFAWDESKSFLANTLYLIPTDNKFLLGFLNSKILFWFYQQLSPQIRGGFVRYIAQYVQELPIPETTDWQQDLIAKIVEYILHLKPQVDETNAQGNLIISYFEQIIDALAYELYLAEEIHAAGKEFFAPLLRENLPNIDDIEGDKSAKIKQIFERLFNQDHIIRQNIVSLDTIENVRIIEGKA